MAKKVAVVKNKDIAKAVREAVGQVGFPEAPIKNHLSSGCVLLE